MENYSFKIFNRWGELIFSTNDFNARQKGLVKNFIDLIEKEFYNGITFHRVIPSMNLEPRNIFWSNFLHSKSNYKKKKRE
ncbi:peptidylprolyl isomerase [bacterium]|nr:peptidylprolyl isomerase [bacterium]